MNHKRISQADRNSYKIAVKQLNIGSLSGDMLLIVQGVQFALPLFGVCNPQTLWDTTCYAFDLVKRFF